MRGGAEELQDYTFSGKRLRSKHLLRQLPTFPLPHLPPSRYIQPTGRTGWSRVPRGIRGKSELHRVGCQVTPGRRKATDRATENKPPGLRVRPISG